MSHSSGLVRFSDGAIWHYEYNGTVDVCISHIYPTFEEMNSNWRKSKWMNCECGESEKVEVHSSYGGGFMLDGVACRKCQSLTEDAESRHKTEQWVKDYYDSIP